MISKSIMITFHHDLNERKTKPCIFTNSGNFFAKSRKNANFKNHVGNFLAVRFHTCYNYIEFLSITFCRQNCVSLPSSLFLYTGVKLASLSDNYLQNHWATPRFSVFCLCFPLPLLVNIAVPQKVAKSRISSWSATFLKTTLTQGGGGTKKSSFLKVNHQFCKWL